MEHIITHMLHSHINRNAGFIGGPQGSLVALSEPLGGILRPWVGPWELSATRVRLWGMPLGALGVALGASLVPQAALGGPAASTRSFG